MSRQPRRKRAVILETSSHYMIVEQIRFMLEKDYEVSILIRRLQGQLSLNNFIKVETAHRRAVYCPDIATSKIASILLFYLRLPVLLVRSQVVVVSTGPENLRGIEAWLIYTLLRPFRRKVVLTIRNPLLYLRPPDPSLSTKASSQNARFSLAWIAQGLAFETATQMRFYLDHFHSPQMRRQLSGKSFVMHVRFSDYIPINRPPARNAIGCSVLRIGLLGSLDRSRRDYELLLSALQIMSSDTRSRMEIQILGSSELPEASDLLLRFNKYVKILVADPTIPENKFTSLGLACAVLLAPLCRELGYGTAKGSGSFGDAVYLRRPLILPSFADPNHEFDALAHYYLTSNDLANTLESLVFNNSTLISDHVFDAYTAPGVLKNIKGQLAK